MHVRFDERDVETGHGLDNEAPANERAGNRQAEPKLPRHISTLQVVKLAELADRGLVGRGLVAEIDPGEAAH